MTNEASRWGRGAQVRPRAATTTTTTASAAKCAQPHVHRRSQTYVQVAHKRTSKLRTNARPSCAQAHVQVAHNTRTNARTSTSTQSPHVHVHTSTRPARHGDNSATTRRRQVHVHGRQLQLSSRSWRASASDKAPSWPRSASLLSTRTQ